VPTRFLLTALVVLVVATSGCDTTLPSDTTDTTPTATNNNTGGSDSPNNGSEVTQPTAQEVGEATRHALEIVGWTIASVRPVTEMQGYLEGTVALPTCPTIEADIAANALNLAFDFGQGCAPSPYVSPTVGGRVSGSSVPSLRSFELGNIALEIDGAALTGAEYGGYSTADGITTIAMTVNLVADSGFTVSGPVTIELDPATGDFAQLLAARQERSRMPGDRCNGSQHAPSNRHRYGRYNRESEKAFRAHDRDLRPLSQTLKQPARAQSAFNYGSCKPNEEIAILNPLPRKKSDVLARNDVATFRAASTQAANQGVPAINAVCNRRCSGGWSHGVVPRSLYCRACIPLQHRGSI